MTATVFVYGTLKRGYPNFARYMTGPQVRFLAEARTCEAYPLVVGGRWRAPFLVAEPGRGVSVRGELFDVDAGTLARLDVLEEIGQPDGYICQTIAVERLDTGETVTALAYLMPRARIATVHATLDDVYPLDAGYVEVADRADV